MDDLTTIPIPLKRCKLCGTEKPATTEYFRQSQRGKNGLRGPCKDCSRAPSTRNRIGLRDQGLKRCSTCGEEKPFEAFRRDGNRSDGRYPYCKQCDRSPAVKALEEAKASWPDNHKQCSHCKEIKPATLEFFAAYEGDKLRPDCRVCRALVTRKYVSQIRTRLLENGYDLSQTKRCSKCDLEKPATPEYFRQAPGCKDGLRNPCKTCIHSPSRLRLVKLRKQGIKRCPQCGIEKTATTEHFGRDKATTDGLQSQCKLCQSAHRRRNVKKRREQARDWSRRNPEKIMSYNHNRRALKRNAPGKIEVWWWKRCLEYFDHRCAACGGTKDFWHVLSPDHWHTPLSKGGPNTPDNIIPLCFSLKDGTGSCNQSKSDRPHLEWLYSRFPKKEANVILARINAYFEWVKQQDG